ncbi:MAG: sigma 54-interacting transcriptional regulator [Bacillota bacterium]|nr:sigma 54-interacting transcriptional regulator [Bacillota bacterium]
MGGFFLIAPYRKLANLACETALEMGVILEIKIGKLEEGVRLARQALKEGASVILSQGATAWQIVQENLPIPVVEIIPTGYDLLRAVLEAQTKGGRVGILDRPEMIRGAATLEEILGLEIIRVPLQTFDLIDRGIDTLVKQRVDVVIGNICVLPRAAARGMQAVLIPCGREAIAQALRETKKVLAVRSREKAQAEEIRTIVNFVDNGIIAVDAQGTISAFNPMAERILGLNHAEVIGQPAASVPIGARLVKTIATGKTEIGEVEILKNGTRVVVNMMPIIVNARVTGAVATFQEISKLQMLDQKVRKNLRDRGHVAKYHFTDILGPSPKTKAVVEKARRFGKVDATVLICGETGVGKEYFAHAMHSVSPRREGPFIAVNCAAVPENLLESELFGYAEGAFTGAKKGGKQGLFELAHGGTIFLDEISEMSERLQTRLLRVLQEHEVMRLGDDRVIPVDIRVVAATNRDLRKLVGENRFRADLYYRINVLTLVIPPLRERREDIPALVENFLWAFNKKFNKSLTNIEPRGMQLLSNYTWPGNIRELRNIMERLVILTDEDPIPADLVAECLYTSPAHPASPLPPHPLSRALPADSHPAQNLARLEEQTIRDVLASVHGNKKRAAQILGVSRTTLWRRLKKI